MLQGSGFRLEDSGLKVQGSGLKLQDAGLNVQGALATGRVASPHFLVSAPRWVMFEG